MLESLIGFFFSQSFSNSFSSMKRRSLKHCVIYVFGTMYDTSCTCVAVVEGGTKQREQR